MAEAMYKATGGAGGEGGQQGPGPQSGGGQENAGPKGGDNIVDAEFEEKK